MGMEKRLLFDRVTLDSGDIAPGNVERAAVVEANLADTGLSIGNRTAVAAGIAAHPIAIQLFPQSRVAFADALVSRQNVAQRGHTYILRLWLPKGCRFCRTVLASLLRSGRRGKPRLYGLADKMVWQKLAGENKMENPAQFDSDFAR